MVDTSLQHSIEVTAAAESPADGSSPTRLDQFEDDIRRLGVKGGNAEPERRLVLIGLLATVVGLVLLVVGMLGVQGASSELAQGDNMALMLVGLGVTIVGVVVWARYSLSRYLRYWLVRQIYEERAQTDRIVEALEGPGKK